MSNTDLKALSRGQNEKTSSLNQHDKKSSNMDTVIFIDTETGGTDPQKHSLLSVGLVAWTKDQGIIDSCEILLKSEKYKCTKEAIKINKFKIEHHESIAVSHKDAITAIRNFCVKNTGKTKEIQIAGHNIQFDVAFLKLLFAEQNRNFSRLFSHRMIDTFSILKFLVDSEKIALDPISSANAFKVFKINVEQRHSALGDAVATAKLYEALMQLIITLK